MQAFSRASFAWRNLKIMQLTRLSKGDAWSLSYQWGCGCLNKQTAYIFADQLTFTSFTYFHLRSLAWARSLPRWSMTRQVVWQTWCTNKSPTVSFGKCPISPPKSVGKICFDFGFLLPDFPLPARLALPSSKWFRRRPYKIRFFQRFGFISNWCKLWPKAEVSIAIGGVISAVAGE